MLNMVETFSGIGAQAEALKNLKVPFRVSNTVEWEIGAMYAYDIIHNGPQDVSKYRYHTKETLVDVLSKFNLSATGKEPLSYQSLCNMNISQLKAILCSIERNNNLVDITTVHAAQLDDDIDILTYSFPCQDLSVSSHWWHNDSGIEKGADNRSSLLWEIERILNEFVESEKPMPKFLLMENVSAILSKKHIDNFKLWQKSLEEKGYYNKIYTLNAKNFGIPQGRQRTYMLSIQYGNDTNLAQTIDEYFFLNDLENIKLSSENIASLNNYLKLDYNNDIYRQEAIESTPNFTPSREKIYKNNVHLAIDDEIFENEIARTITTKQDRNPNSGLILYSEDKQLVKGSKYRNLTPREAFLLMGFKEKEYENLIAHNFSVAENRNIISSSKMLKLAGNSIVVNVLEAIFLQVNQIKNNILSQNKKVENQAV